MLDCSKPRRLIAACPLAFGEVSVKKRIQSVLHYKKPAFWIIVVSLIVCAVVAVCFLTNPKSDADEPIDSEDSTEETTDTEEETTTGENILEPSVLEFRADTYIEDMTFSSMYSLNVKIDDSKIYLNDI